MTSVKIDKILLVAHMIFIFKGKRRFLKKGKILAEEGQYNAFVHVCFLFAQIKEQKSFVPSTNYDVTNLETEFKAKFGHDLGLLKCFNGKKNLEILETLISFRKGFRGK